MYTQTLKSESTKDKSSGFTSCANKNFSRILQMFMLIGIYFPCGKSSKIKAVCGKIVTIFFNLFFIYYLILQGFDAYNKGFEVASAVIAPQFTLTMFMHHYLSRNAHKIVENCKFILRKKTNLPTLHEKPVRILIAIATAVSFGTFCVIEHLQHAGESDYSGKEITKNHFFNHSSLEVSLIVLAEFLMILKNWILFMVPGMTIILLSFVYYELGNFIYELKMEIANIMGTGFSKDLSQIQQCANLINKASRIVREVDSVLNKPMFYILSLLMIKILILTAVLTRNEVGAYLTAFAVYLGCGVLVALLFILCLTSRIQDNFSDTKNVILTSDTVQNKILSGGNEAISYVGLVQILNENSDKFYVTAMGFIKIEKTVILTMISAIVSYGIIFNQMIASNQTKIGNLEDGGQNRSISL